MQFGGGSLGLTRSIRRARYVNHCIISGSPGDLERRLTVFRAAALPRHGTMELSGIMRAGRNLPRLPAFNQRDSCSWNREMDDFVLVLCCVETVVVPRVMVLEYLFSLEKNNRKGLKL